MSKKGTNYLKGILPVSTFKGKDDQGNAVFWTWEYNGVTIELGAYREMEYKEGRPIYSYIVSFTPSSALPKSWFVSGMWDGHYHEGFDADKQFEVPHTQVGKNVYPTRRRAIAYLKNAAAAFKEPKQMDRLKRYGETP